MRSSKGISAVLTSGWQAESEAKPIFFLLPDLQRQLSDVSFSLCKIMVQLRSFQTGNKLMRQFIPRVMGTKQKNQEFRISKNHSGTSWHYE